MKTTPSKKPVKFSAGRKVLVTRAGVELGVGRYVGSTQRINGEWHQVNMAPPRSTPNVRTFRAANLTRV